MIKFKPFTQEERNQIQEKFEEYLEAINAYLDDKHKAQLKYVYELNKLNTKLNDSNVVIKYRLSCQINDLEKAHNDAYLEAKEGIVIPEGRNYFEKSLKYMLKIDGTPESKRYNKELVEAYAKNPEAYAHNRIRKLINYDPKELIQSFDDVKMLNFYKKNLALCNEASEIMDVIENPNFKAASELKVATGTFKEMFENISFPLKLVEENSSLDFLAMPEMNKKRAKEILNLSKEIFGRKLNPDEQLALKFQRGDFKNRMTPSDYFIRLETNDLSVNSDIILKYKAVKTVGNKTKETSLSDSLKERNTIKREYRSDEEIKKIYEVSFLFQNQYSNEFQKRLGEKLGKAYFVLNVEKEMNGGLFDRMFRKPSNEFKAFMDALKDFTNPDKPNFLNKDVLDNAGKAYLNHVKETGGLDLEAMNTMRKSRVSLVQNTLETIADLKNDDTSIRNRINASITALLPKDFDVKKEAAMEEDEAVLDGDESVDLYNLDISLDKSNEKEIENNNAVIEEINDDSPVLKINDLMKN